MPVGDLKPEIAVLLASVAALLWAAFSGARRQWLCSLVAAAGLTAAGIATLAELSTPARFSFDGVLAIDGPAVWAKLVILGAALITVALSPEWLRGDARHGEYYAVLLLATLGAMLMAGASDTMQLVVAVLLTSVTGYTLAAYHRGSERSVEAGMKFFLVGALANSLLLVGVVWLFGIAGTTDYADAAAMLPPGDASSARLTAIALVAAALCFKLGAVPAHTWMPDVAEGAPAPAAAYLTVVPKIGAAVALARFGDAFAADVPAWRTLIAALAVATMTLGNLAALRQSDLRRMLGWSAVSQSGFALVAVAMVGASPRALTALIVFLAAYAAANLAAFAVVTELRGRTALGDYAGLVAQRPAVVTVLVLALLSLVGIPPLAGFVGKLLVMLAALEGGYAWLAAVVVANTIVSLFYYVRALGPACFDAGTRRVAVLGPAAAGASRVAALLVVALGLGAGAALAALGELTLLP